MPPRMMTRSASRFTVAPRGGRTSGRVGRGARRTRPTVRKNNETIGKLDGQGNDRVGSQDSNQGNGRNQNGDAVNDNIQGDVRNVIVSNDQRGCTYKEFLACKLKEYDGKGGVIVYTRWIEKMESVQDMSGREPAVGMSWEDFKNLTREEFCPVNEMQKLETEFWNHAMIGAGHVAYTDRFHVLSRSGVISSVLIQRYQRTIRQSHQRKGLEGAIPEYRVTRSQKGSATPFPPNNDHLTSTFVSQTGNTSKTIKVKPSERPELEKKPYPSSLPEKMSASVVQQMAPSQKRSSGKQNPSTNYRGKHKSRDVKEPEQKKRVRSRTIIGMVKGDTSKKRPREQSEQWTSNEISFPSMQRNLRAKTKANLNESRTPLVGFFGEVSYPIGTINLSVTMRKPRRLRTVPMEFAVVKSHSPYNVILGQKCLRSLGAVASTIHSMIKFPTANGIATMTTKRETLQECRRMEEARGPTLERRTILPQMQASELEGTTNKGTEGSQRHINKIGEPDGIMQSTPISSKKNILTDEKDNGEDEPLEKSLTSNPSEKVVIHEGYSNQTITIGGNLTNECRSRHIEMLRKHADAFA
ncbi:hypothetical protein Tco_0650880 [Tanacetum coccineum]